MLFHKDFDADNQTLKIFGKGRGSQFELIDLSRATTSAILDYLQTRREINQNAPLFASVDPVYAGHRLTGEAVRKIVVAYCQKAGITKQMSPNRIRHSSITAALDATDGNVRKVQKLSRHAKIDTLLIYDDNRQKTQLELSELLSDML